MEINEAGNFLYLIDKNQTSKVWTVSMIKYVGVEEDVIHGAETLERRKKVWTIYGIEYHDQVRIRSNYAGQALTMGEFIIER